MKLRIWLLCGVLCGSSAAKGGYEFSCPLLFGFLQTRPQVLQPHANEPELFRTLKIAPEVKVLASRAMWKLEDVSAHAEVAFDFYLQGRLAEYPWNFQEKVKKIIKEHSLQEDAGDGGFEAQSLLPAHGEFEKLYPTERDGIIGVWASEVMRQQAIYFAVLVHQVEHLIQHLDPRYDYQELDPRIDTRRGEVRGLRSPARHAYYKEFGAIRAEYEYWRMVDWRLVSRSLAVVNMMEESAVKQKLLLMLEFADEVSSEEGPVSDAHFKRYLHAHGLGTAEEVYSRIGEGAQFDD